MWGTVLKRDLLEEAREEDRFHSKEQVREYIKSEIEKCEKYVVIKNLDVSLVEDLSNLFCNITAGVELLNLSGWKTSNVQNMSDIFYNCDSVKSINLSGWDISNVKDMSCMFDNCINLKSLNLSGWNTPKIEFMDNIFYNCPAPYEVVKNKIVKK